MNVLTTTRAGQGSRENDFDWTIEGQLVLIGLVCSKDRRDPDGGGGCGRSFSGPNSLRATTTAQVRDLPLSRDDVVTAVPGYWEAAGYAAHYTLAEGGRVVDDLLATASAWPAGTIVERRLDVVRPRRIRR